MRTSRRAPAAEARRPAKVFREHRECGANGWGASGGGAGTPRPPGDTRSDSGTPRGTPDAATGAMTFNNSIPVPEGIDRPAKADAIVTASANTPPTISGTFGIGTP